MAFGSDGKKWSNNTQSERLKDKLVEAAKPQAPLKPRIEEAQKKLQIQISKLDMLSSKLQEKDKVIFNRVVAAMQNHDTHYARLLSGELSQIRKVSKMLGSAKLAFEQVQLRLNTITEFGDIAITLGPAMSAIKGIQAGLSSMMPEADQSFGQISGLLGNIMSSSSQMQDAASIDSGSISLDEDAVNIIEEAGAIVEESTKDKFPNLPSSYDSNVKYTDSKTQSSSVY